MVIFSAFFLFFRSLFVSRISPATEILILRQQLLVLNRTVIRPKLRRRDRLFWICLCFVEPLNQIQIISKCGWPYTTYASQVASRAWRACSRALMVASAIVALFRSWV